MKYSQIQYKPALHCIANHTFASSFSPFAKRSQLSHVRRMADQSLIPLQYENLYLSLSSSFKMSKLQRF